MHDQRLSNPIMRFIVLSRVIIYQATRRMRQRVDIAS